MVDWVSSGDGRQTADHGQCAVSLLPRDADTVLVLPPSATSWHRITLPKAPANKLRAALEGLLEDHLLTDTAQLHFAVSPQARSGQDVWIATCEKAWLRSWLEAMDQAGHPVNRIVPGIAPLDGTVGLVDSESTPGHLGAVHWAYTIDDGVWLASSSPEGAAATRLPRADQLGGAGAAQGLIELHTPPESKGTERSTTVRYLADPTSVTTVEKLFDRPWALCTQTEWLLMCARTPWNLAQFDFSLSSRARMGQRWREMWREWMRAPAWRPARWAVALLLLVWLAGLNLTAWQEQRDLAQKRTAAMNLYRQAFPTTPLVADPLDQMRRDIRLARAAKGQVGPGDLEAQLAAAALAMPEEMESPMHLVFDAGQTRLSGWTGSTEEVDAMQQSLRQRGWSASQDGDDLVISSGRD